MADTQLDQFEKWLPDAQIEANRVSHAMFSYSLTSVRGVEAKFDSMQNENMILLPIASTLFVSTKQNDKCPDGFQFIWNKIPSTSRLALLLLLEWEKGVESKYYPYISILPPPNSLNTPFHWSIDLLESFPYPPLINSVKRQEAEWKKLYTEIQHHKAFNISYERFVWGMELVLSRAFQGVQGLDVTDTSGRGWLVLSSGLLLSAGGTLLSAPLISQDTLSLSMVLGTAAVLCTVPLYLQHQSTSASSAVMMPMVDSCNHRGRKRQRQRQGSESGRQTETETETEEDEERGPNCVLVLDPLRNRFEVRSTKQLSAGEEVTLSYGDKSNDYLLQYFGFVEPNNAFDVYKISEPLQQLRVELCDSETIANKFSIPLLAVKTWIASLDRVLEESSAHLHNTDEIILNKDKISDW
eukprot:CAMPEP_0182423944 /NCGR_PEP_ID=MMETSP1167-20130531/10045_1 /TAXON_ID=2988 /ORGANISM="Mallomonas Sp, Strain CCMP3275" /LENGTH=410 /DNA_ID=CAMNT_0024603337 /DNA_START=145 /DNA_END=1374 /DNA_ORIENTATION=+